MIVRSLDADGDWTFGQGKANYVSNSDAVMQLIHTRLLSFLGDCFFAINDGINWWVYLAGSKDQSVVALAVNAVILNTEGVNGIVSSEVNYDPVFRSLSMKYTVTTVYTGTSPNQAIATPSGQTTFLLTEDGSILTTQSGSGLEGG